MSVDAGDELERTQADRDRAGVGPAQAGPDLDEKEGLRVGKAKEHAAGVRGVAVALR